MPVDLTPINTSIVTSKAPQSSVTPGEVAAPYQELANNLSKAGEVAESAAENFAQTAGENAVTRSADGSLQIQRQPIIGPASGVYARAAQMSYLAQTEPEIQNKMTEARIKYANDPAGFQAWAKQYGDNMRAGSPSPLVTEPVQKIIAANAGQNYRGLLVQADNTNTQNTLTALKSRISDASNQLADLAFQGGTDTQEYKTLQGNITAMYGELGSDPRMGYPQARIDSELSEMTSQHKVMAISGQAMRMMDDSGSPTARADAKKFLIDKIYGDPGLNLSMSQRHQAVTTAMGLMEARSSENKALIEANKAQVNTLLNGLHTTQPYNPISVNDAISNAAKIGDAESYYKLTFAKGMHDWDATVRTLPMPQQVAAGEALSNMNTPFERRLVASESSGNPRLVNSLGYAGLYQFGAPRLADLGLYTPGQGENLKSWQSGAKWTGTFNIPNFPQVKTLQDFLGNPAAQQAAFGAHTARMDQEIKQFGLDKYEGQTVGGVTINRQALYGMIHLGGAQGTANALASGGANAARDAYGTSVMDYARRFGTGSVGQAWFDEARTEQVNRFRNYLKTQTPGYVDTVVKMLNQSGDLPEGVLQNASDVLRETGQDDLRQKVDLALQSHYGVEDLDKLPTYVRQAWVSQTAPEARDSVLAFQVHQHMAGMIQANAKAMEETPYTTYAARTNAKPPLAYNFDDPGNVAAVARARAGTQAAFRANDRTGPVSVFEGKEGEAFGNALTNGDSGTALQSLFGLSNLPPDVYQATLAQKPVANAITGMMGSKDPVRMSAAMQAADKLWRNSPTDAEAALGSAAMTKLQAWQALQGNFTPPEIAERLNASDDPSTLKAREAAKDQAETETKSLTPADMAYKLGTGFPLVGRFTGATPNVPFDSIKGGELVNDYRATYAALRSYGVDADKASDLAVQRLQSTWGVSQAAGNQVMKNPPERFYPAIDGSRDWITQDLNGWISKRVGPQISQVGPEEVPTFSSDRNWTISGLISDGQTQAEISAHRPPSYQVAIQKADGTLQILDGRVAFDPSDHVAQYGAKLEQRRQTADFLRTAQTDPNFGVLP
jgi:hypothetical protein